VLGLLDLFRVNSGLIDWLLAVVGGSIAFQGGLFGGRKAAPQAQAAPGGGSQAAKDDPSTPPTSST
jgi:hypothetical protein